MKKLFLLLIFITLISCTQSKSESAVLLNSDSEEVTFIIELNTKENLKEDIESFAMNISNSILNNEPSTTVYGYYISDDASKITLIERYNTSQDALQHAKDFMNGDNFNRFFELFEIENFTDDVKEAYLLVECPRQLFPFARRIIYDLHADGALPPLMLDPVNFAELYKKKTNNN